MIFSIRFRDVDGVIMRQPGNVIRTLAYGAGMLIQKAANAPSTWIAQGTRTPRQACTISGTMGRMKMQKKSNLPARVCVHCGLPFTWRKKWERDWDQVKYCSDRCRRAGPAPA